MTVHMISVGVTALDFLAHPPDRLFADGGARDAFDEAASVVLADAPAELTGADPGSASRWLSSRLPPGDPDEWLNRAVSLHARPDWPGRFSAEADTLRRTPGRASSAATDAVVLLASDTVRGLPAALWNAVAVAADLAAIHYLAEPTDAIPDARGKVLLARVPGLDAGNERGFRQAMGALGTFGRSLRERTQPDEEFCFHLSGGFKAAIPYLIGLAEWVRSLDPERPVNACVLHDTAGDDALPIRLPLRRLVREAVEAEIGQFEEDGTLNAPDAPGSAALDGYAYEKSGGRIQLTPFGEGLRSLFAIVPHLPDYDDEAIG